MERAIKFHCSNWDIKSNHMTSDQSDETHAAQRQCTISCFCPRCPEHILTLRALQPIPLNQQHPVAIVIACVLKGNEKK